MDFTIAKKLKLINLYGTRAKESRAVVPGFADLSP